MLTEGFKEEIAEGWMEMLDVPAVAANVGEILLGRVDGIKDFASIVGARVTTLDGLYDSSGISEVAKEDGPMLTGTIDGAGESVTRLDVDGSILAGTIDGFVESVTTVEVDGPILADTVDGFADSGITVEEDGPILAGTVDGIVESAVKLGLVVLAIVVEQGDKDGSEVSTLGVNVEGGELSFPLVGSGVGLGPDVKAEADELVNGKKKFVPKIVNLGGLAGCLTAIWNVGTVCRVLIVSTIRAR